jgi:DNA-binding transcriptional LysR family regulator
VAREGSFRRAARRLGYVQSAVSQQVAYLEARLGQRLLDRGRGSSTVTLTDAGELVVHHAGEILAQFRAAQADLTCLTDGLSGTLRVGIFERIATRLMPAILTSFTQAWPQVRVVPTECATDSSMFSLVESGAVDLAFAEFPLAEGPFDSCLLLTDPYVLLVARDSALAATRRQPTWAQIGALPLIASNGRPGQYEVQLRARGIEPKVAFRSDTSTAIRALVGAGLGAAIVPSLAADLQDPTTVVIALRDLAPSRTMLCWQRHRQHRPWVDGFREIALDVAARVRPAPSATSLSDALGQSDPRPMRDREVSIDDGIAVVGAAGHRPVPEG